MKKHIFIINILLIILMVSFVNVYASEGYNNKTDILNLTISDAIKFAQKNSTELVNIEIKLDETKKARDKYIGLQEEYDKLLNMSFEELDQLGIYNIAENYVEKMLHQQGYYVEQTRYTISSLENQKKQLLAKIAMDTKSQYFKIILLEKSAELELINLEKFKYKRDATKINYDKGLMSEMELITADINVFNTEEKYNNSKIILEIEKTKFLQSIGIELKTKYNLKDMELSYIPLEKINLESIISNALENRPEIAKRKNEIKNIEHYKNVMSSYYGSYSTNAQIETKRCNNAKIELEKYKSYLNNYIRSKYLALTQSESALKNNFKKIELLDREFRLKKILYDNGQISISDVTDYKSKLLAAQIESYKLLVEYIINKEMFEKIDILSY